MDQDLGGRSRLLRVFLRAHNLESRFDKLFAYKRLQTDPQVKNPEVMQLEKDA